MLMGLSWAYFAIIDSIVLNKGNSPNIFEGGAVKVFLALINFCSSWSKIEKSSEPEMRVIKLLEFYFEEG